MNVSIVGGKTLKVKFAQDGAKVTAQVLKQDESLRACNGVGKMIKAKGAYEIKSVELPEVDTLGTLYIRGEMESEDLWNAKVVCVIPQEPYFTKGKIYNVRNGFIEDNKEHVVGKYKTIKQINDGLFAQFIEIVE